MSKRRNASPPPEPAPVNVERLYMVTKTCRVQRPGEAPYILQAGTVISSFGFDVDALQALGVPMEGAASRDARPPVLILE